MYTEPYTPRSSNRFFNISVLYTLTIKSCTSVSSMLMQGFLMHRVISLRILIISMSICQSTERNEDSLATSDN